MEGGVDFANNLNREIAMRYLVVLALAAVAFTVYAQTGEKNVGRYTLVVSHEGTVAWRMNMMTGAISYCIPGNQSGQKFNCSDWFK